MVQRYELEEMSRNPFESYRCLEENEEGEWVKYEDYERLKQEFMDYVVIKEKQIAKKLTDCIMPPRIEAIHLRSPLEVEDMWMHRVKWLCAQLGVNVHGN